MAGFETAALALIALVFVLAGTIKGTVGIGLPTAAVGMLSQSMDPRLAISLVVFPSLLSNAWQIWRLGGLVETVRRFAVFLVCISVTILIVSVTVATRIQTDWLILVLGGVIVAFSVMSLAFRPPAIPARFDRIGQVVAGTASGIMGGFTAIWAPAMVPYLMGRGLAPDVFMRATGVIILTGTVVLAAGYGSAGVLTGPVAALSLAMVLPAIAGFQIGERLRRHLDAERFRKLVLLVFLAMGLNLIRRAVI